MASVNNARAKLNQQFVSGWIEIFAAPKAMLPHVEWSLERALDCKLQITWSAQPLTPGSFQTRLRFSAPSGRAGEIATALAGWNYLRFDVCEMGGRDSDGARYLGTPSLGLHHATVGKNGDVLISENQIGAILESCYKRGLDFEEEFAKALGVEWEAELAPYREGQESMRWLHATG